MKNLLFVATKVIVVVALLMVLAEAGAWADLNSAGPSDPVADPYGPTYLEYAWGSGRVLATMQTIEWGYGDGIHYQRVFRPEFLRNEIDYGVGAGRNVLLVQDVDPWDTNSNAIALSEHGAAYSVVGSSALSTVDLSLFGCVMYASDQYTSYYSNLAANLGRIESFVANGGTLLAHACDQGWHSGSWEGYSILPGGVGHVFSYNQYIHIVDVSHPVVSGLSDDYLDNWTYSSHGCFTGLLPGTTVVMESTVPEPSSLLAFASGLAGFGGFVLRRRRS